jgi:hypothetical protein
MPEAIEIESMVENMGPPLRLGSGRGFAGWPETETWQEYVKIHVALS